MSLRLPAVPNGPWRNEYPFASKYLDLGPSRVLHYVDEGQGPALVMIHGNPTWSFMFRALIKNLSGFRRLALDQMGMGLSARPGRDYGFTLSERLEDFDHWIKSLNLKEPFHLMVHDWGGPVGLGWATENLDQVASLTIMNTGLKVPTGFDLPWKLALFKRSLFLGRLLATELNCFTQGVVRYGTQRPLSPQAREGFLAPYSRAVHRESLKGFVADIPLKKSHVTYQTLARLDQNFELLAKIPTFLIWGLRDFVFSRLFLDDFRGRLPEARVLALPRAGHYLLEDEPETILKAVKDFLSH
ncbi:MAG: alpha/beta fold hydrolase [Deltaproteobacteria bacterium]|jgi:haloalkane dehalogenase|nr:alpha/beta fold hydrolase [Deltaproteobacteria bacterium]